MSEIAITSEHFHQNIKKAYISETAEHFTENNRVGEIFFTHPDYGTATMILNK